MGYDLGIVDYPFEPLDEDVPEAANGLSNWGTVAMSSAKVAARTDHPDQAKLAGREL